MLCLRFRWWGCSALYGSWSWPTTSLSSRYDLILQGTPSRPRPKEYELQRRLYAALSAASGLDANDLMSYSDWVYLMDVWIWDVSYCVNGLCIGFALACGARCSGLMIDWIKY